MISPVDAWGPLGRPEPWLVVSAAIAGPLFAWILRGAPAEAEAEAVAPTASYRNKVTAGVAAGLSLIVLGAVLAAYHGVAWSLPAFAMGFGLVATLVVVNDRYRHVSPSLRRTVTLSRAALNATLAAGILIVVNVIAFRYGGHVVDLTRERTHSLASLSRNQVESLNVPVTFHLVHGRSALARRQEDRVAQLLELYRSARPDLVRVERLDRYAELSRGDELARRAPELGMMPGGGVLIEYAAEDGPRFAAIGNQEMFESEGPVPGGGAGVYASTFRGEDAITSALIRLRRKTVVKVGFTTGHGEPGFGRPREGGPALELWKARLVASGYEPAALSLLDGEIQKDVKLIVIAGAREAFKPQEVARLREYVDSGAPILACLDGSAPTGLEDLLKSFNLELGPGTIVDPRLNLRGRASFAFCPLEPTLRHPTTDGIPGDRAALIVDASPIHVVGTPGAADDSPASINPRMVPEPMLRSGPTSWVESDFDPAAASPELEPEKDRPGPAIVATAVAERKTPAPSPRLVLISSRSFGEDAVVEAEPTNLDLLMNAAAWLRGRGDSVGVPAKVHSALTLVADPGLRWRLVLAPTLVASATIGALGALVYFVRRD